MPVGGPGYVCLVQNAEMITSVGMEVTSVGIVVVGRVARGVEHYFETSTVAGKDDSLA